MGTLTKLTQSAPNILYRRQLDAFDVIILCKKLPACITDIYCTLTIRGARPLFYDADVDQKYVTTPQRSEGNAMMYKRHCNKKCDCQMQQSHNLIILWHLLNNPTQQRRVNVCPRSALDSGRCPEFQRFQHRKSHWSCWIKCNILRIKMRWYSECHRLDWLVTGGSSTIALTDGLL